jgi:cell division protein FtsL
MHRSTFFLVFMAIFLGFLLFKVKYEVVSMEEELNKTHAQIRKEEENIHILKAEWSHLNEPQRLQKLAQHLDIVPIKTEQIVGMTRQNSENLLLVPDSHHHLASLEETK